MEKTEIIKAISDRTGGDIYLGVVGAVRTGKSTFIKRFMETLVVPNIEDEYEKKRALDELPQSAAGKTIMTTEPKFVPNNAAKIKVNDFECNIRMVDCVGYIIPSALGHEDENGPRLVRTPWYSDEIPFVEAAETGTSKVIRDHSTIGIIITTDGTIGEIPRSDYIQAEERVVNELKEIGKPFIVILNTTHPESESSVALAEDLRMNYGVPVMPMSVIDMNQRDMYDILKEALYEFPVLEVNVEIPDWIAVLKNDYWLKKIYLDKIKESVTEVDKLRDVETITSHFTDSPEITKAYLSKVEASTGIVTVTLEAPPELYNDILKEIIGVNINSKADLLNLFQDYSEYSQIKSALKMVKQTGYGVASPTLADMKLEKPEIIRQGSRYGVRLKAVAPSIHMIRVDVESTFEPIIGSELQSKELINYLMKDYETDPDTIWKSEIFGRSLDTIVQEGIQAKLNLMPENARYKLGQTLTKIVNKGSGSLIAIIL